MLFLTKGWQKVSRTPLPVPEKDMCLAFPTRPRSNNLLIKALLHISSTFLMDQMLICFVASEKQVALTLLNSSVILRALMFAGCWWPQDGISPSPDTSLAWTMHKHHAGRSLCQNVGYNSDFLETLLWALRCDLHYQLLMHQKLQCSSEWTRNDNGRQLDSLLKRLFVCRCKHAWTHTN